MGSWYVVRTKTGAEDRVARHLSNQGFENYVPRYSKQVSHARKITTVMRPLFQGYVFVRMDIEQQRWRSINGTFGVISLVQFGDTPRAIPTAMLDAVRNREDKDGIVSLAPERLKKGDFVRVRDGAFADYTALLEEVSDDRRAILLIDLMGRKVRVSADRENLAKAS